MGWKDGAAIAIRDVLGGRCVRAKGVLVVEDSPARVVVWTPTGAPILDLAGNGQGERFKSLVDRSWSLVPKTWNMTGVLTIVPDGAAFSVQRLLASNDSLEVTGWYINLQDPLTPTDIGFDTMDRQLDLVVSADLQTWSLKDEDVFAQALRDGLHSAADHEAVLEARDEAIRLVESKDALFSHWRDWSPPPRWQAPTLPGHVATAGLTIS